MDFTRQPLIESVITAKEGCKLVVRSSKGTGQEEYFVDAVEVVSFGNSFFFRSQEKPKSFLVPATDYEILEVREARMVLKNVGVDRSIKIAGGKEPPPKQSKEQPEKEVVKEEQPSRAVDRKRDRRRTFRRRKRGDEVQEQGVDSPAPLIPPPPLPDKALEKPECQAKSKSVKVEKAERIVKNDFPSQGITSLLPPPPNLISDTIEKYKDNKLFEGVFVKRETEAVQLPKEEPKESSEDEFPSTDSNMEEGCDSKLQEQHLSSDEGLFHKNPEESFKGQTSLLFNVPVEETEESASSISEEMEALSPEIDKKKEAPAGEEFFTGETLKPKCDEPEGGPSPSDTSV